MKRLVAGLVPFIVLLSGCTGTPPGTASGPSWTVDWPAEGGTWEARLSGPDGDRTLHVILGASTERLADGREASVPVLRIEETDPSVFPPFQVHLIGLNGTIGARAPARVTYETSGTSYSFEDVVFEPNLLTARPPDWTLLGPGLWGQTFTPEATRTVRLSKDLPYDVPATWTLARMDDGCAVVRLDVPTLRVGEATFCDGPLPDRVEYTLPERLELTLERTAVGGPLPSPVDAASLSPLARATDLTGAVPAEFPLDAAVATAEADVRTQDWFAEHTEATLLSGSFGAYDCGTMPDGSRCPLHSLPGPREVFEWTLAWGTPDGEGLRARVAKAAASPPGGAQVLDTVEAPASGPATIGAAVSATDAHTTWRAFVDGSFSLVGLEFDLTDDRPLWVFRSRLAPDEGDAPFERVETTFEVSMATGFAVAGYVAPRG